MQISNFGIELSFLFRTLERFWVSVTGILPLIELKYRTPSPSHLYFFHGLVNSASLCHELTKLSPKAFLTRDYLHRFMFHGDMSALERDAPQQAPSFKITPRDLLDETLTILKTSKEIRDEIVHSVTPSTATFENVILPLAEDDNIKADRLKILISRISFHKPRASRCIPEG